MDCAAVVESSGRVELMAEFLPPAETGGIEGIGLNLVRCRIVVRPGYRRSGFDGQYCGIEGEILNVYIGGRGRRSSRIGRSLIVISRRRIVISPIISVIGWSRRSVISPEDKISGHN